MHSQSQSRSPWVSVATALALLLHAAPAWTASTTPPTPTAPAFATPEQAVAALAEAVATQTRNALARVLGPDFHALVNPDEIQGAAEFAEFRNALNTAQRLVTVGATRRVLEIGPQAWPFPIPIVKSADGWRFDTQAGIDELLNRRIGRNELDVLRVLRACVEAQREYASRDLDGDEVREFAQKLHSTPGTTDGLYWPPQLNGEISPLGPLLAFAQAEGYRRNIDQDSPPFEPFHGYAFKMLFSQGSHAPGGKHRYLINGNMIAGFAFVAWPAEYGESGIMTFIVNHQGRIYHRDLGPKTATIVRRMKSYDPDPGWLVSPD